MATTSEFRVGDKVTFGRTFGEKTAGTVVKVNSVKLKVRQDESRGTMSMHPVGTVWGVPPSLCTKVGGTTSVVAPKAAPAPKRSEAEIMSAILDVYAGMSPENLTCDGECSRSEVARRAAALRAKLRALEAEIGRKVSEDEAYASYRPRRWA